MFSRTLHHIPFVAMSALSLFLFCTTLVYWNFRPDVNFLLTKQNLVHHPIWRPAFYVHITGGMLSVLLGPLQFLALIRQWFLNFHRIIGKLYVASILFIGAPTGLYMAFYANGGWAASLGFILMSLLWFYTTWMGIRTVRTGRIEEHKKWMIRSYAVTFSAVSLRIWVPLLSIIFNMEHLEVIIITAWISWLFNLLAAEVIIKNKLKT